MLMAISAHRVQDFDRSVMIFGSEVKVVKYCVVKLKVIGARCELYKYNFKKI